MQFLCNKKTAAEHTFKMMAKDEKKKGEEWEKGGKARKQDKSCVLHHDAIQFLVAF
jgi:hypothetical protein